MITWRDRLGHIASRTTSYRMSFRVAPGLYRVGAPGPESDVFVTANYKMSFDALRGSLSGMDAWVLVLDTKGINVWCAAGKGTFGDAELIARVFSARLHERVSHRRIIVPQLGAPGVSALEVRRQTGFRVVFGPVRAADTKAFVAAGYRANSRMRQVTFGAAERLVLTPMEFAPALKRLAPFAAAMLAVFGFTPSGFTLGGANAGWYVSGFGLASVLSGALATPLLLPWLPSRSFALKGLVAGIAAFFAADWLMGAQMAPLPWAASLLFFPLASSYMALQFTGSTVFTGPSGVRKELRWSLPVYASGTAASIVLMAAYKLMEWGVI